MKKQKLSTKLMNKNKLITKGEVYKIIDKKIKIEKGIQKDYENRSVFLVMVSETKVNCLLALKRDIKNYESN